ncbi:MAG: formate--tetrahydrofolate ligase [Dehalococcoidia bacterium]|nr:formate--tetrahydrofolate ligase [Dehalococcoidia bacterium]
MPTSDLEIARSVPLKPILQVAEEAGLLPEEVELYGRHKAKVSLDSLERLKDRPQGKLVVVTGITPTPLGEGKTVTTTGLSQGLGALGERVIECIREPSMGPVFGIKGGGTGGGWSQVVPMEDINLHFTGDIHAVGAAHNLLAAILDASLMHGNPLEMDPASVTWRRVIDVNDRVLRNVVTGLGGRTNGITRETGFDITAASEVMAIIGLTSDQKDLRERLARIVVGYTRDRKPVNVEQLRAAGAMTVILKDAIKPNLVQTLEGQPCLVHAGPFANIAQGNNSVLADRIALSLADYVVTESGFGADCGLEKFMDIVARQSGLRPSCVVVTCTVRALKMHGGLGRVVAGRPLPEELGKENLPALEKGAANMMWAVGIARQFGVPVVVAVNRFEGDTDAEVDLLREKALEAGAAGCAPSTAFADGGRGAAELAELVRQAASQPSQFRFLYEDDASIKEKVHALVTRVYNADGASYDPAAERQIRRYEALGWGNLPLCIAKTALSLSHEASWKGVPKDYLFPIRDVRASIGAGFLYPLAGDISTMPGLGRDMAAHRIDVDADGNTVGLS